MLKIPGGGSEQTMLLRQGQMARIGRTEWADYCVPHDDALGEFHFALECGAAHARLFDLQSGAPTWVNGEVVAEHIELQHGDTIRAGETNFLIELSGVASSEHHCQVPTVAEATDEPSASNITVAPPLAPQPSSLADWCRELEMSDDAIAMVSAELEAWAFIDLLAANELFPDALRLAGALLTPINCVAWGSKMVRRTLTDNPTQTLAPLDVADAWIADPSEGNRRACEAIAQASSFDGPASWIALGAFWSSGSIGPADQPEVLPPFGLTAKAIAGGLMMTATSDPLRACDHYRDYLTTARRMYSPS